MKHKEDIYKNQTFTISSAIGQGHLGHKATVVGSYGHMCLCKIEKAFISGGFDELGIFKIVKDSAGTEILQDAHIDYSSPGPNVPSRYSAPDSEVMTKWERIISAMKVKDSEADIVSDRRKRENAEKEASEKLKTENIQYIKTKLSEIESQLKELFAGQTVKKLSGNKQVRDLITDMAVLEKLQTLIR